MQGYLEKQTSGLFRKFQSRYFLLQRALLLYYPRREDVTDSSDSKHLDLSHCIAVGITDGDESAREFWIELPGRTYWFRASSKADRDCWISNLFIFNASSALDAFPIASHIFTALMDIMKTLTSEVGDVEGLFRVPGDKQIVDRASSAIYRCNVSEALSDSELSAFELGSLLKKLLRELPETLLTRELFVAFTSSSATAQSIRNLVEKLATQNRDLLMKLSVLLHRQIQKVAITKASIKSLSMLFSPCLSPSSEGLFLDISRLISIVVEQGSTVFGYTFSRAVAQQVDLIAPLAGAVAQQDRWVNQKLEKEVIPETPAQPHFTEIEPIDNISIEVEHITPIPVHDLKFSSKDDEETAMVSSKSERSRQPSPESSRNVAISVPNQKQFQRHEFGLSSESEMTPRGGHRSGDDVNVSSMNAALPLSLGSYRPQTPSRPTKSKPKKGSLATSVQRKDILSMGITPDSMEGSNLSPNTSLRLRRLSLPQGKSRIIQGKTSHDSDTGVASDSSESRQNSQSNVAGAAATLTRAHQDRKGIQSIDRKTKNGRHEPQDAFPSSNNARGVDLSVHITSGEEIDAGFNRRISQLEGNTPIEEETSRPAEIDDKFIDKGGDVGQPIVPNGRRTLPSINIFKDKELESPGPNLVSKRDDHGDFKSELLPKADLSLADLQPDSDMSSISIAAGSPSRTSLKHRTAAADLISDATLRKDRSLNANTETSERETSIIVKKSINEDMQSPPGRYRKITSSTQTALVITKDFSSQTKMKLDPDTKETLEAAQRQILDCKERISHYQKKCRELEQAMGSQTQALALLQNHNTCLQTRNRDLFEEQDALNSDLEEALLQLEQARQQIKMQSTINANLTASLSQQKLQYDAIIMSLESKNQAVIEQSAHLAVASQMSSKVQELSETCENVNVMLKKRLDMMRSRVQMRLHNSRENLASIESRAIMGLTESKQRMQLLQTELKFL